MKARTLLIAAQLAASIRFSAFAQDAVYSDNVVGYVNLSLKAGKFNLVSNPLDSSDDTIASLFSDLPNQTTVFKFDSATGYNSWVLVAGNWFGIPAASTVTVEPGEGVFIKIGGTIDVTNTFVGVVRQGSLRHPVPQGLSIQSSEVPVAGDLQTIGFPATEWGHDLPLQP